MGVLECGDRHCVLGADQLIGREPSAGLRLEDDSVSWRHASLRWTGQAWELQDLGSRNGTFLDGQRLATGARTLLRLGCELRFGNTKDTWVLANLDGPATCVVDVVTGERIAALDDLIALPLQGDPELFISRQADGAWLIEGADRARELRELEELTIGSRRYRFEPGAPVFATSSGQRHQLTPSALRLEFLVTRDEEYVEIVISHDSQKIQLRPRAHSYALLTLARLRLADQADTSLKPECHGWVHQDRLLKMLATTPTLLATDIHRARRQFSDAGVLDAAQIVERRVTTHELRIGVPKLEIRVA